MTMEKPNGSLDPRKRRSTYPRAANDDGRSGYGSESVRPYLRAQLRQKELLQFPERELDVAKSRRR